MIKIFFCLILLFSSCKNNKNIYKISDKKKQTNIKNDQFVIIDHWYHNDDLHEALSKEYIENDILEIQQNSSLSQEQKVNAIKDIQYGKLTGENAFGDIEMIFKKDYTYSSYFDNQYFYGVWKIEDNLLFMKRTDVENNWIGYKYELDKDNLIIFDKQWLMTFTKKKES